jgi:hypothetical protein
MAGGERGLTSLRADEFVARCALYPGFLKSGAFASEALLDLGNIGKGSKPTLAISSASRALLPRYSDVHAFGCRLAVRSNARKTEKAGRSLSRPSETSHYVAFYELSVAQILALRVDGYGISVEHMPEEGEHAHCNILAEPDRTKTKTELSQAKTDIVVQVSSLLRGPVSHICPEDIGLTEFIAAILLPTFSAESVSPDGAVAAS